MTLSNNLYDVKAPLILFENVEKHSAILLEIFNNLACILVCEEQNAESECGVDDVVLKNDRVHV